MSAREEVLARIRAALADGGEPIQPASAGPDAGGAGTDTAFRTQGGLDPGQLVDLLAERLTDYRALVRRTSPAELAATASLALA